MAERRALIAGNPGTIFHPAYVGVGGADIVCVFEDDQRYLLRYFQQCRCPDSSLGNGFQGFEVPNGPTDEDPERPDLSPYRDRLAALIYGVHPDDPADEEQQEMSELLEHAAHLGLGYVYVTDGGGSNPWDRLASYWLAEVELLSS